MSAHGGLRALERAVEDGLGRLLSLCDRLPLSPHYGSADRAFWHYRVDKDYASATFAQVAWPLVALALDPALPVPERLRPRLFELGRGAMSWWASRQHADGAL